MTDVFRDFRETIRELAKQVADVRRRVNTLILPGVAIETKDHRVNLELGEKDPHTGGEFKSGLVAVMNPSGAKGGGHSSYRKPGLGEAFLLISPGGEVGEHSRAIPAGHTGDRPAPGKAETDGFVDEVGNVKWEVKDGLFQIKVGGVTFKFSAGGFEQTGGAIKHDGVPIDKTHKHEGVVQGGAKTGLPTE